MRVLHPRGGEPGDGAREAVASEILAGWHRIDAKVARRVIVIAHFTQSTFAVVQLAETKLVKWRLVFLIWGDRD